MDITVTMPVEAATKVPRSWAPWAGGTWTGPTGAADAPLPLIVTGPLNMNVMVRCLGSREASDFAFCARVGRPPSTHLQYKIFPR